MDQIDEYIQQRSRQIHERRMDDLSAEDIVLALQNMADVPGLVTLLRDALRARDPLLGAFFKGAVGAAVRCHSVDLARAEAQVMFSTTADEPMH